MTSPDDPLEIPEFLRRDPNDAPRTVRRRRRPRFIMPARKKPRKDARTMKALRLLGYTDSQISKISPAEALTIWRGTVSPKAFFAVRAARKAKKVKR